MTAALAASAAGQIAARDGSEDAKPPPQQHKASAPADDDRTSLPVSSEDDHVSPSSAISESVPVGVHALSAGRPAVSTTDAEQHQRQSDGSLQRQEPQQQPVPQADVAHSAAGAEAELRSSPAGPSHSEGEQPDGWETLLNGTDSDGWDDDAAVATVADAAVSDAQSPVDDASAGPPPGGTMPSAAVQSETSARQAAPPDEPRHASVTSHDVQPSTNALAEDRSHQLAAVLEDANGAPADQPAADPLAHLQHSAANGVAQPAPVANGLLDAVTLHDADVPTSPANAKSSTAADAGARPEQCGLGLC